MTARDIVDRDIRRHGRPVTLIFIGGTPLTITVTAHLSAAAPQDLASGSAVQQLLRTLRVAQAEMDRKGAPRLLARGDGVQADGAQFVLQAPAERRYDHGIPVLQVATLRGAG